MEIYDPGEDTFLMKQYLESLDLEDKNVLEVGTGSGILTITMAERNAHVTAVDINEKALRNLENKIEDKDLEDHVKIMKSDIFDKINSKYDIIVFNPPYLPNSEINDPIWAGGEKGTEIIEQFLENAGDYLTEDGEAYIIGSNRTPIQKLIRKYDLEIIDTRKLWFEKLFLLKFS